MFDEIWLEYGVEEDQIKRGVRENNLGESEEFCALMEASEMNIASVMPKSAQTSAKQDLKPEEVKDY